MKAHHEVEEEEREEGRHGDTGEEAGQLDRVAAHIADTYEEEVQIDISTLTDLLPVILVVVLGIAVLMIVLAFFLPLISSIDQLTSAAS